MKQLPWSVKAIDYINEWEKPDMKIHKGYSYILKI